MASGGTWQTQNKVRPGAYINVVGVPKALSTVGDRGVVALAMPLEWGGQVIEITSQELLGGDGLLKAGVAYTDRNFTPSQSPSTIECAPGFALRLALQSAQKAIVYRSNFTSAVKATLATIPSALEDIITSVKAKYAGAFGNRIKFNIESSGGQYILKTYIDDNLSGTTKSATLTDLTGDSLIDIEYEEDAEYDDALATKRALSGGTNGASKDSNWLSSAIKEFNTRAFNVFYCEAESSDHAAIKAAVDDWRNGQGIKIQGVLLNDSTADDEGIINIASGVSYVLSDGDIVRPEQVGYMVAGITAGASLVQSNTGAAVVDAIDLTGSSYPKTNDEIIAALNGGKFLLSRRSDGAIVVEKDINSLHNFTPTHGYIFSKNRPLRVMDNVCNDVKLLFNKSYLGKVNNDDNGRNIFKGDLIAYCKDLERIGAIQNFDAETDVEVLAGSNVDDVVVNLWIQPIDSMEKLYMTINVEG